MNLCLLFLLTFLSIVMHSLSQSTSSSSIQTNTNIKSSQRYKINYVEHESGIPSTSKSIPPSSTTPPPLLSPTTPSDPPPPPSTNTPAAPEQEATVTELIYIDDEEEDTSKQNYTSGKGDNSSNIYLRFGNALSPRNSIEIGQPCSKSNAQACKSYPNVGCVSEAGGDPICRCSFLTTWNDASKICELNVFAPCSGVHSSFQCGPNMMCTLDTIKYSSDSFCRCLRGFKPTLNKENVIAHCVKDPHFSEEIKDEVNLKSSAFPTNYYNFIILKCIIFLILV